MNGYRPCWFLRTMSYKQTRLASVRYKDSSLKVLFTFQVWARFFCRSMYFFVFVFPYLLYECVPCHTYGLLTKCEIMMAGYWPSSFFACLWTETKSRSINSQKRTRPISNHLDRTNLVNKGFIIWLLGKFCLWDSAGSPERARALHLARSGSQSHAQFRPSCPLAELAI